MFHVLKTISFSGCTQVTNQPCHEFLPDATLWTILRLPLTLYNFNTVPAAIAALYSGLSSSSSSPSSSFLPPSSIQKGEKGGWLANFMGLTPPHPALSHFLGFGQERAHTVPGHGSQWHALAEGELRSDVRGTPGEILQYSLNVMKI